MRYTVGDLARLLRRTTIDQICEKAGVKKGSFYYFFQIEIGFGGGCLSKRLGNTRSRNWTRSFRHSPAAGASCAAFVSLDTRSKRS